MIGAIAGDIIGSVYEHEPTKSKNFPLFQDRCQFTDDTVLTVAIAAAILDDRDYREKVREIGAKYPGAGYGASFYKWLREENPQPYNSWGNGSAMRVSPIGFAFDSLEEVLAEAARSAAISHNHPEGIKGAQATAMAIFLARTNTGRAKIKNEIEGRFGYDLSRSLAEIRPGYRFDISCKGSVPESIICFLESESYEDAIRNAVSLGGDSDTMACICGGIAEAYYGHVPQPIIDRVNSILTPDLLKIIDEFRKRYGIV